LKIKDYTVIGELKNDNSGYGKWGFAKKGAEEVFVKQFLTPTYPLDSTAISESQFRQKVDICLEFERQKRAFYNSINTCLTGNVVTVREFFRHENKYYIVTEKVRSEEITPVEISAMSMEQRVIIAKVILHSMDSIHRSGVVHGDLKPDNILIKETYRGMYTAKIIDFDSGFAQDNAPKLGDDLQGDMVYLAPEAFLFLAEENAELTNKIDIFALGIVLHEYFCGDVPGFNRAEYDYTFESVLDGNVPIIDSSIPRHIGELIERMLDKNPENRPTAAEAFACIGGCELPAVDYTHEVKVIAEPPRQQPAGVGVGYFSSATDDLL